jgi:hypothetical protein
MKSTCIANGRELLPKKPRLPAGYKTPKKSVRLAKQRARRKALRMRDDDVHTAHPEKVRTLKDAIENDSRTTSKMRSGGINRMRNHR